MERIDEKGDVGIEADMIQALKNLISAENHAIASFMMTSDKKWLDVNNLLREMRTKYLKLIVSKGYDQKWCLTKHLLSSIMALEEVGNRFYSTDQRDLAQKFYGDAGILTGLLLELNKTGGKNGA